VRGGAGQNDVSVRYRQALPAFGWSLLAVALALGCSGAKERAQAGGSCFRADDCEYGLVCIQATCTNDLSLVQTMAMGPAPDPTVGMGGAPADAAAPPPAPPASMPDAAAPPPPMTPLPPPDPVLDSGTPVPPPVTVVDAG
jgi:hypothetical protein